MTSRSGSSNLNLASPLARLSHPLSGLTPHEGQSDGAAWTSEYSVRCKHGSDQMSRLCS